MVVIKVGGSKLPRLNAHAYAPFFAIYRGVGPDRLDASVILVVTGSERPSQPVHSEALGLTPTIWKLTKRWWYKEPGKRPTTSGSALAHLKPSPRLPS